MTVSIHVSSLTFASGAQMPPKHDSIVVFVGPNSAGKSQSLKDIRDLIYNRNNAERVSITNATIGKTGTVEEYIKYLAENSIIRNNSIILPDVAVSPSNILDNAWENDSFVHIGKVFVKHIQADDRLSAVSSRKRIDLSQEKPHLPLQALDGDPEKELEVSKSFEKIFGKQLALDRGVGSVVNLHVGTRPAPSVHGGQYSPTYNEEVRKLPDMNNEGDGFKAAAGLLLHLLGLPRSVYLVDEPDVYLHPPQAYAAAKELIRISKGKQLFLATHNAHFVQGLLDSDDERLVLIRLDRPAGNQEVHIIDQVTFNGIKSDPLIKFSSLLEALFFRTVIVCENEADCLFYRSTYRAVNESAHDENVFWISAHGKQNIKKLVAPLRKFGVQVISLPDLDIIDDETNLRALIESHGGDWSEFESDFDTIATLMSERKPTFASNDVEAKICKILEGPEEGKDGLFPPSKADEIKRVLRSVSPWRELKESGLTALGKGNNQVAAQSLLGKMSDIGILVPEVGALESFYSRSGKHGIEWVNEVLRLDIKTDKDLSDARKFAKKILAAQTH